MSDKNYLNSIKIKLKNQFGGNNRLTKDYLLSINIIECLTLINDYMMKCYSSLSLWQVIDKLKPLIGNYIVFLYGLASGINEVLAEELIRTVEQTIEQAPELGYSPTRKYISEIKERFDVENLCKSQFRSNYNLVSPNNQISIIASEREMKVLANTLIKTTTQMVITVSEKYKLTKDGETKLDGFVSSAISIRNICYAIMLNINEISW